MSENIDMAGISLENSSSNDEGENNVVNFYDNSENRRNNNCAINIPPDNLNIVDDLKIRKTLMFLKRKKKRRIKSKSLPPETVGYNICENTEGKDGLSSTEEYSDDDVHSNYVKEYNRHNYTTRAISSNRRKNGHAKMESQLGLTRHMSSPETHYRKLTADRHIDKSEINGQIMYMDGFFERKNGIIQTSSHVMSDKKLEDRREELGFRRRTFWKSCCGKVIDRRATQFFTQATIGVGVMLFCIAKIWTAEPLQECVGEDTSAYSSLLAGLVGFYIPSPSMMTE